MDWGENEACRGGRDGMLMEVYIFIDVSLLISSSSFNSIIQSTTKQPIQQQAIYTSLPSSNITISHIYTQPITTHHQKSLCLPLPQLNNHVLVSFFYFNLTSHVVQRYTNIISRPCLLYLIRFLQRLQRWMAHSQRSQRLYSHYTQRSNRCIQPLPSARSSHPWCINCEPKIQSYRECRGQTKIVLVESKRQLDFWGLSRSMGSGYDEMASY